MRFVKSAPHPAVSLIFCLLSSFTFTSRANSQIFQPAQAYTIEGYASQSVAIADLNADGRLDLVVVLQCASVGSCDPGGVGVLLNVGDGTFQLPVIYSSGGGAARSVAVGDVNGDGIPDLVVANFCSNDSLTCGSIGVLLGNGDGTFQSAVTYSSGGIGSWSVVVQDLNGDGRLDVVVTSRCTIENCNDTAMSVVGVLLGNGDGTFQPAVTYPTGGSIADSVAIADVNGDGKPDILVANETSLSQSDETSGTVGVLLGDGNGTFRPVVTNYAGVLTSGLAVQDVNGDRKPDLVVSNFCTTQMGCSQGPLLGGTVGVLLGNGDGTFQPVQIYDSGGYDTSGVAVEDVNKDGKLDLIVSNYCSPPISQCPGFYKLGSADVLLGNGDGTFQAAVSSPSGGLGTNSLAVADVNGDNAPDIVLSNWCYIGQSNCDSASLTNGSVSVVLNQDLLPTTTSIAGIPAPVFTDQYFTLSAGVVGQTPALPTGTVTFSRNGITLATIPLAGGKASYTTYYSAGGTQTVYAAYSGDSTFYPSTSLVSQTVIQSTVTIAGSPQQPLAQNSAGDYIANVIITNTGNVTVSSLQVTNAGTTLGSGSLLSVPAAVTNLAPGASATLTLKFPANSVSSGAKTAPLKVSGSYSVRNSSLTGNWALSFRSVTL